ncbi:MAG: hypothetical protein WBB74_03265 [Gaiellaceae bacterium]
MIAPLVGEMLGMNRRTRDASRIQAFGMEFHNEGQERPFRTVSWAA